MRFSPLKAGHGLRPKEEIMQPRRQLQRSLFEEDRKTLDIPASQRTTLVRLIEGLLVEALADSAIIETGTPTTETREAADVWLVVNSLTLGGVSDLTHLFVRHAVSIHRKSRRTFRSRHISPAYRLPTRSDRPMQRYHNRHIQNRPLRNPLRCRAGLHTTVPASTRATIHLTFPTICAGAFATNPAV
jgi:hypothetical protein